ncbi:MAG: glycosyltransferase [Thermoanaerobaculia bacterium]
MGGPSLSLVIPAWNEGHEIQVTLAELTRYLRGTGLSYEVLVVDDGSTDDTAARVEELSATDASLRLLRLKRNSGKGAAVRRGVQEARGETIGFIDADLPYQLQNLGDAVTMVQSGTTDIAIGGRDLDESQADPSYPWLRKAMGRSFSLVVRTFLTPGIPDTQCGLKIFTAAAAKVLFAESRINGFGFDFEVLFLARKFGFRIERIPVSMSHRHESKVRLVRDSLRMLIDVIRVRRFNRQQAYRLPRRCPICFSVEVWTLTQINGWVVRECRRCKCRFLAEFPSEEELRRYYDASYYESDRELERGYGPGQSARSLEKTNSRRFSILRKHVQRGARVLEVGAGIGHFGRIASREMEYVGIDLSEEAARAARSEGLDVYCANLRTFVNPSGAFDAVTLFHVFEHLADPHDALARLHELLKPGGALFLVTPDTESLLCAVSGDRWVSYKFPEHLILYSHSALIELLENSGFEIVSIGADFEYCDHPFLLSRVKKLNPALSRIASAALRVLPDPLPVTSGSVRIVARRRGGAPYVVRPIRAVEPTHAR